MILRSAKVSLTDHLGVLVGTFIVRVKVISRYKGSLLMDILMPLFLAAMPILLGQAMAGSTAAASANFQHSTGLTEANYIAYMIIGANVFSSIMTSFWLFGLFIRREQTLGTLESLFMSPAHKLSILAGLTLYVEARSLFTFVLGYSLGCIVFGVNPLQGQVLLALFILLLGLIPINGLSFLLGALVLKVKQANTIFNTFQWPLAIISGIFFPITVLPVFLQIFAFMFPGFYVTHDIQAALTGLKWLFGNMFLDLGVLFAFTLICPLIGYWIFAKTEARSKRAEGIGQF
ncbi:MAG: ABC transporter permease [Candidatus Heimdallarchaeota archaeon]|nr:MAG: ABC transporter permease [Candidatus Heimdallarchaeota archaeon]